MLDERLGRPRRSYESFEKPLLTYLHKLFAPSADLLTKS